MALQSRERLAAAWAVQIARRLHRTALRLFPTALTSRNPTSVQPQRLPSSKASAVPRVAFWNPMSPHRRNVGSTATRWWQATPVVSVPLRTADCVEFSDRRHAAVADRPGEFRSVRRLLARFSSRPSGPSGNVSSGPCAIWNIRLSRASTIVLPCAEQPAHSLARSSPQPQMLMRMLSGGNGHGCIADLQVQLDRSIVDRPIPPPRSRCFPGLTFAQSKSCAWPKRVRKRKGRHCEGHRHQNRASASARRGTRRGWPTAPLRARRHGVGVAVRRFATRNASDL